MRRIDLLGVDEVGDGEMKMAWVDGTDQVLVINQGGEFTAVQGICSHEYFELDKGFLTNGTLTCALHLSRFDLTSYTTHIGKATTGDLLSKAALLEGSRTYMKGLITIERSANGTDSFLGEFGMNLSKAARSVAIPSLEIDQPDCRRAAHSSSVGPIDETQLFYLESRGIPPDEARKFIVLGFLEPVVARVPLASAQDRLRESLEEKWIAGTDGVTGEAAA